VIQSPSIFEEYVNEFLEIKQEASGWSKLCQMDEQKRKYIIMFYLKEGILLEYDKIKKILECGHLQKLMLNFFWGTKIEYGTS
jgi:hypothetical protein